MAADDDYDEDTTAFEGDDLDLDDDLDTDDDDLDTGDDDEDLVEDLDLDDDEADDDDDEADDDDEDDEDEEDDEEDDEDEDESLDVLLARDQGGDEDDLVRLDDEPRDGLSIPVNPIGAGEFTCRSCFLVKRRAQLADDKKLICFDCA